MDSTAVAAIFARLAAPLGVSGLLHRRRACVLGAILLGFGGGAGAASNGSQVGVFADGTIDYAFLPCFSLSCDGAFGNDFAQSAGYLGSNGPAIVDGFAVRGSGSASVDSRALIAPRDAVPELRAKASVTPGTGSHPGFCCEGAYFFASTASAQGRQYYTYTGNTPQTFTMRYTITGFLAGATAADEVFVQGSGGLSIFDDLNNNVELPMGNLVDIDQVSANGSAHTFRESGSVSITLNHPGDSYYLVAFLAANVGLLGNGVADMSSTLRVDFTAGDTSQLTAALQATPVPEPAAAALLSLGLLLTSLVVAARRR